MALSESEGICIGYPKTSSVDYRVLALCVFSLGAARVESFTVGIGCIG